MTDLLKGTISGLLKDYRESKVSPLEICTELFERIEQQDARIGAFLQLDREGAMEAAREASNDLNRPLAGVPIAVKDNISTRGIETTCGSKILRGYIPPYDATVIQRLKDAGAVILGKTNCDEFAMGSSTENSAFQITRNPWNPDFAPGGSSGGSASAVAAGFAFGALGSDTGGSVRQPAAFCGMVGLKPTYGRVSRYGLVAFGSSLDCIGPITRSAEDAALILRVIAGYDPWDATSDRAETPDFLAAASASRTFSVGVPEEYFGEGLDQEVGTRIEEALQRMEVKGYIHRKKISLPHTSYAVAAYYIIATAEASSNLSRFDGVKYGLRSAGDQPLRTMYARTRAEGFGAEVKRRIMLGTFALSAGYYEAYYSQALKVRSLIARDFQRAFDEVDLICTPTSPTVAFRLGERTSDPLAMYLSDIYTVTSNLVGLPAISVPVGLHSNGLPVGLQIIGRPFDEVSVLQLASTYLKEHPVLVPVMK